VLDLSGRGKGKTGTKQPAG